MIDSLKKTLHDRMTSPFTGSFIVSWIIVNWKFVLALLSSEKYDKKIIIIQELFTPFWWDGALCFIIYPLLGACFYISLYQLIIAGSIWVWFWFEGAKEKARGNKLLTIEESQKLIIENGNFRIENEKLKANNAEKEKQRDDVIKERAQVSDQLNTARIEKAKLKEEYENLDNASQSQNAMLDQKTNKLNDATAKVQSFKEQCDKLTKERNNAVKDIKFRDGELDTLNREIVRLTDENEDLKAKIEIERDEIYPRFLSGDELKKCQECNNDAVVEADPGVYLCNKHFENNDGFQ